VSAQNIIIDQVYTKSRGCLLQALPPNPVAPEEKNEAQCHILSVSPLQDQKLRFPIGEANSAAVGEEHAMQMEQASRARVGRMLLQRQRAELNAAHQARKPVSKEEICLGYSAASLILVQPPPAPVQPLLVPVQPLYRRVAALVCRVFRALF